jgi:hypothetical protein
MTTDKGLAWLLETGFKLWGNTSTAGSISWAVLHQAEQREPDDVCSDESDYAPALSPTPAAHCVCALM